MGSLLMNSPGKGRAAPLSEAASRKYSFTIRSSRRWKLMMASLPPGLRRSMAWGRTFWRTSSSELTAIRRAWKTRVAGWIFFFGFFFKTRERTSTSCFVVSIGFSSRCSMITFAAIRHFGSSP